MDKNLEIIKQICAALYKGIGQESLLRKIKENKVYTQFLSRLYKQYGVGSVGEQFLWDFLTYNLDQLYGRKTQFGIMVLPGWLLSEKSIKRWNERKVDSFDYFLSKFLNDHGIKKPMNYGKVDLEDVEDMERGRFLNTEVGFLNCQSLASYNEYSEYCKKCNFKKECSHGEFN